MWMDHGRSLFVLASVALILGCGSEDEPLMRVTRSELFSGELEHLAPHLADTSGRLLLNYSGPSRQLKIYVDIWNGGSSSPISRINTSRGTQIDGEIAVTLHSLDLISDDLMYRMVLSHPGGSAKVFLEKADIKRRMGVYLTSDRIDVPPDERVAVWGFGWTDQAQWSVRESERPIEESARALDWAVVVSVALVEEEEETIIELHPVEE